MHFWGLELSGGMLQRKRRCKGMFLYVEPGKIKLGMDIFEFWCEEEESGFRKPEWFIALVMRGKSF